MGPANTRLDVSPAEPAPPLAALLQDALACHRQGQVAQAAELYRAILARDAAHFDALHLLGVCEYQQGRHEAAAALIEQAIARQAQQAGPYANLGLVRQAQQRYAEALACFEQALALQPDHAEAHNNRGNAQRSLQRYDAALASYDRALQLKPDYAVAHSNRGNVLQNLRRYQEALESYAQALHYQADYAEAHNHRAQAWRHLNQIDAALASCVRALQLRPDYADAHHNCGNLLQDNLQHDEALAFYRRAQDLQPDYAEAHLNEALCRLSLGDFARGWEKYEWRWAAATHSSPRRNFSQPLWLGQVPLAGKTLLLHAEQGLGDTVQFCRFVPQLVALGATVLLEVQAPLSGLLAALPGVSRLLTHGAPLPDFDYHCPLLSLPLALHLELATIPAPVPYLRAEPHKVEAWRRRLAPYPRPWVGLIWSGNPSHVNDHNRSIPLAALAPLWQARASFISAQTHVAPAERAAFVAAGGIDVMDELHDFTDTAALLSCVDSLVTVDTAGVHLAGALARPALLLLPYNADFRWLIGRADSPWYPTLTLLRQTRRGDWDDVLARAVAYLNPSAAP